MAKDKKASKKGERPKKTEETTKKQSAAKTPVKKGSSPKVVDKAPVKKPAKAEKKADKKVEKKPVKVEAVPTPEDDFKAMLPPVPDLALDDDEEGSPEDAELEAAQLDTDQLVAEVEKGEREGGDDDEDEDDEIVYTAKEKGIEVRNTPKASSQSVAELALGHMFSCARYISISGHTMREGKWEKKA